MKRFEQWTVLSELLKKGSLSFVDLCFAESVLKKLNSSGEEHAALLAVLFAMSRIGHLTLDISKDSLAPALKLLGIEDVESLTQLLMRGVETFPEQGITLKMAHEDGKVLQSSTTVFRVIEAPCERPAEWVCRFGNHLYLQKNWVCESEILFHLKRLSKSPPTLILNDPVPSDRLNLMQQAAVRNGLQNSLSLLTGGPGTGKTFTAAELVKSCLFSLPPEEKEHFRIILAAPTGKAVAQLEGNLRKAIGETVKIRSGTLHSILGIKTSLQERVIQPLFADLIVVDECSMIDSNIFSQLLSSAQTGTRLILIGDKDQLPPVEAGSIFADLLDLEIYPSTKLTECLRSESKEILALAKSMREGNAEEVVASLSSFSSIDWLDLEEETKSVSQLYAQLWERCKDQFPSSFTQKPTPDQVLSRIGGFSILSCMRQGPLGVDAINGYFLSQYLKKSSQGTWWIAPIMITRNDHELDLFNGDLGYVVRYIGDDFSLREFQMDDYILFHDRKSGFRQIPALALNAFEYSYCQSVHKSQGSEYGEVLILVPNGSQAFGREVLYTALTRAKNKVSLAGSLSVLLESIASTSRKTSGLMARLPVKTCS